MWVINIKTILITVLLVLSLGCSASPILSDNSKPSRIDSGGMLIPKVSNTVFTMCGLPIILIIHSEDGIEVYGGENMVNRAKTLKPDEPLVIAEISKTWGDQMVQCPPDSDDMNTPSKKKPREWYARF